MSTPNRIIDLPEVIERTSHKRSSIYSMVANNEFPKPIKLSARRVGWVESEVNDWIQSRIAASRPSKPEATTEVIRGAA